MQNTKLCRGSSFGNFALHRVVSTVLVYSVYASRPAYSWWETGHRAVARIAAAHLTPVARTRVSRILSTADSPEAVANALAQASTWADETKAETQTGEWHYIDLALQDHKSDIPLRCPAENCAPARIHLFSVQLSTGEGSQRYSELDALRYLVHFVGDIHQPLHTISDADLGGNCERLDPPIGTAKNLHAVWDGVLVNEINPDDKALADDLEHEIQGWTRSYIRGLSRGRVNDWVWESHQLAKRVIYRRLHIPIEPIEFPKACKDAPRAITEFTPDIDADYLNRMKPEVRTQLIKAGLRLARLLNESL